MKAGWEIKTLAETCNMYQPKTISGKEMQIDGAYPVFGANGIIGRYNQFNHAEPQLLITCRGATCGSVNVSLPNSWITGNAMVVRPKDSSIDLRYLEYCFRGGIDISTAITGAAQPQITRTNLEPLTIQFPTSLDEQQRIVALLDKAFAGIATATANAQKNLTNARGLFDARLGEVFSSQNSEWRVTKIGEISDVSYGFTEKASFAPVGPKFLRITDIQDGEVSWENVPSCPISPKDYQRQKLEDGDIVFARTGATTGKSFLVRCPPDAVAASYLIRLRVIQPDVLPEFVQLFFQTPQYWAAVSAGTSGSAQGGFNASKLADMRLPVPPVEEQRKATEKLEIANVQRLELQKVYDKKLQALNQLKQSLLQKAFAGELT